MKAGFRTTILPSGTIGKRSGSNFASVGRHVVESKPMRVAIEAASLALASGGLARYTGPPTATVDIRVETGSQPASVM